LTCIRLARIRFRGAEISGDQMAFKPTIGEFDDRVQCAGFFKEVGGTWNDLNALFSSEALQCLLVEFDHTIIRAADDQEGRDFDKRQYITRKIRSPTTRNHRANAITQRAGRHQSRRRACTKPESYVVTWQKAPAANCRALLDARFGLPLGCVERIAQVQRRFSIQRSALLRERICARQFVDSHGDLRPEHIWLREPVTIIDCLEFDPKLRANDPLDEIAFLHLECERLGGLWAAERIRRHLARALEDDAASGLFLFYRSHRAMLRARLSIAHLLDPNPRTPEKWPRLARVYLKLAAVDAGRLERILGSARKVRPRA
jgi:aminoglycoside phosphotransferase family enzyme